MLSRLFYALSISAVIGSLCVGCWESNPGAPSVNNANQYVVAAIMDPTGQSGNVGLLALDSMATSKNLLSVNYDAIVRTYHKSIYILERYGKDNLIRIDGSAISAPVYQKRLGTGTNVQDIAFAAENKAYVTQFAGPDLLVINPATGSITKQISLRGYGPAGADSIPSMSPVLVNDGFVFVGCQRFDANFSPADSGIVIKISTVTDSIVGVYKLPHGNPTALAVNAGKLLVISTGTWNDTTDGGIDRIDLATGAVDVLLADSAVGGNIGQSLVVVDANHAYVTAVRNALNRATSYTVVVSFNPTSGTIIKTLTGIDNAFGGLASDGSRLYIGDQSKTAPGIVIFDALSGSKISGPYNVGVNVMSLAYFDNR